MNSSRSFLGFVYKSLLGQNSNRDFAKLIGFLVVFLFSYVGYGQTPQIDDGAFLDPKYSIKVLAQPSLLKGIQKPFPSKNEPLKIIEIQSEVKSQGARGTCSIFSATALLESLLIKEYQLPKSTDLSEEWLQYVTHLYNSGEGSTSTANFAAFGRYGSVQEDAMPYLGETWESLDDSPLAKERCGHLIGYPLEICLVGHFDANLMNLPLSLVELSNPEFAKIRKSAEVFKNQFLRSLLIKPSTYIYDQDTVKALLSQGVPVTLDLDFYYGAWNHRKSTELGLTRNMDHWSKGIVGFPEKGSLDAEVSLKDPAGHSIVLVGYDDQKELEFQVQMKDGSTKTFKHKGVFYFKNSWGKENFGVNAVIENKKVPGYGTITQDYAYKFGTFYQLNLQK